MYYNRFRYYNPKDGSYINQDPIGLQGGINLYDYPRDPVHFVDPWGLAKKCPDGVSNRVDVDALSKLAAEPYKGGRTRAGFSLDKHSQREGSVYSSSSRKARIQNKEAQDIVDDILTMPDTQFINKTARKNGATRICDRCCRT